MTFSGMGNMVAIDGKQFDMDRIDLRAKVGEKEVWEIKKHTGHDGWHDPSFPPAWRPVQGDNPEWQRPTSQ